MDFFGSSPEASEPGRFERLSEEECHELLGTKSVGRIAYCTSNGPVVLPVNYAVRSGAIVFRTVVDSALDQAMKGANAAFQVDETDESSRSGWSVLVSGVAHAVDNAEELWDFWDLGQPEPWAVGERFAFVRIVPRSVTGRRVHPG